MKKFIFALILAVLAALTASLSAQDVLSECSPQTYGYVQPIVFKTVENPCKWEGTYPVQPTEEMGYPTIQVEALSYFPEKLPLGYMTYQRGNLWIVVMNPFLWDSLGEEWAIERALSDGFCHWKDVKIWANPFPGTYSN